MDQTSDEFDSLHFTSTSTPMNYSSCHPQKKRQLIKDVVNSSLSFASPVNKKTALSGSEKSDELDVTMPGLFDFDNNKENCKAQFSFEEDDEKTHHQQHKPPRAILSSADEEEEEESERGDSSKTSSQPQTEEEVSSNDANTVDESESIVEQQPKRRVLLSSDFEDRSDIAISESEKTGDELSIRETSSEVSKTKSENDIEIVENSENEATKSNEEDEEGSLIILDESSKSKATLESSLREEQEKGTILEASLHEEAKKEPVLEPLIQKKQEKDDPVAIVPQKNSQQNVPKGPVLIAPPAIQSLPVQHGRLYGGKMTEERFQRIQGMSRDMISAMHDSLSTLPENAFVDTPKGLRVELLPHQKTGLAWLLWREQQMPPSGILADDMGLGKTLAMIALIMHKKNERKESPEEVEQMDKKLRRRFIDDGKLINSNGTLVVAPASLIFQWEKEVRDRVKDDRLSVYVFHGLKNKRDIAAQRLAKYDIVITTYALLTSELKCQQLNIIGAEGSDEEDRPGPSKQSAKKIPRLPKFSNSVLSKIAWQRIILDEAHEIRNKGSLRFRCCCRLEAVHRWCLTGTPIHNKLWDFFSLVKFLRLTPFSEEQMWKEAIMTNSATSSKRLNVIVKAILLRRTKNQICPETNKPIVDLQPKKYELISLEMQKMEKHCYTIMFEASKQKVSDLLKEGALSAQGFSYRRKKPKPGEKVKNPFLEGGARIDADDNFKAYSCILTLLLRLRQAAVHLSLTRNALDIDAFKLDDDELDQDAEAIAEKLLEMSMAQMSLDEEGLEADLKRKNFDAELEKLFQREHRSTKVQALMEHLERVIECGDKCVIVSQWTSMLSIIEFHIRQKGISYTSITGKVPTNERQSRVDNYNKVGMGPKVMLLALTAGGVGLNLIGGNHLFLLDLHWNPALEQQASDRIYRLGQQKNVFIHKFICNSTIEERVLQLQERKTALATSVLEGAAKKLGKLTREDIMYLFELDKRSNQPQQPTQSQQPTTSKA